MVRGQEEWVNNSRKNFISQILKCLECSASFETLEQLSAHMLKTNHFSKFQHIHQQQQQQSIPPPPPPTQLTPAHLSENSNPVRPNLAAVLVKKTPPIQSQPASQTTNPAVKKLKPNEQQSLPSPPLPTQKISSSTHHHHHHQASKHSFLNQTSLTCDLCKRTFDTKSCALPPQVELIQHLKNVHSINHICTNCGAYFYEAKELNEHLLDYHNNNSTTISSSSSSLSPSNSSSSNQFNTGLSNKKLKSDSSCFQPSLKHHNHQQTPVKASSISPSSSTSSTLSSSSSSSSSLDKNRDSPAPSSTNSKSSSSHPLLALQAFVNGEKSMIQKPAPLVSPSQQPTRLPAKKRPYFEDQEDTSIDQSSNDSSTHGESTTTSKPAIQHGIRRILAINSTSSDGQETEKSSGDKTRTDSPSPHSLPSSSSCSSPSSNSPKSKSSTALAQQQQPSSNNQPLHLLQNMLQNRLDDLFY